MSDSITTHGPNPSGLCMCGCGRRTKVAVKDHKGNGHVKGQPRAYVRGHNSRRRQVGFIYDPATECWNWQRSVGPKGYGKVFVGGRNVWAHRHFYELCRGPIPEGLVLDHLCRNPGCVNPWHLEVVTTSENNRRAWVIRRRNAAARQAAS